MVIEYDAATFTEWYPGAIVLFLKVAASLAIAALVIGWLVAAIRNGPTTAFRMTAATLLGALDDLLRVSPRRIAALSWLAVREAIRRRVVVVFAVFIVLLLFAGWFLDPTSDYPARLYLSFVLTATSYLVLLLALFLSAMSIPEDIKSKTLHTVVTKPVRAGEIVAGRIIGFTVVGTVLLAIMAAISYTFVVRGLSHTHELKAADLKRAEKGDLRSGFTSPEQGHVHKVTVDQQGSGRVGVSQGHWHQLSASGSGEKTSYTLGRPLGRLIARVPVYGKLRFKKSDGKHAERGDNVGDEWSYRSFIAGQTLAAAIWEFDGITEANFPKSRFSKGLPLEMTIEVFRTYKGKTDDPDDIPLIPGSLAVRNPKSGLTSAARIFLAKDFVTQVQTIPRQLETPEGKKLDLFEDMVDDGKLEIILRCEKPSQYFGVAQPDLYFRAAESSFPLNFAKGYLGIWLQMVLVIGFGVMFSTFLSGPIALLATLGALVGGLFSRFMSDLAAGNVVGGGPVEATIRLVTGQNVTSPMEPGLMTTVAKMLDKVFEACLGVAAAILPNFERFSFASHVAYGFDISTGILMKAILTAAAFTLPLVVAGYFFLKTREVAK